MEYYAIIKNMSSKFEFRLRIVRKAEEVGISEAARIYGTTRKTVRKWVNRYKESGSLTSLNDQKKTPHNIPHKMTTDQEKRIVELRTGHPSWGP